MKRRGGPPTALERERTHTDLIHHVGDLMRRNDLLQQRLDDANAVIAMMQAEALDRELPKLVGRGFRCLKCRTGSAIGGRLGCSELCRACQPITPTEQLRRKSVAVRRLLANRMGQ